MGPKHLSFWTIYLFPSSLRNEVMETLKGEIAYAKWFILEGCWQLGGTSVILSNANSPTIISVYRLAAVRSLSLGLDWIQIDLSLFKMGRIPKRGMIALSSMVCISCVRERSGKQEMTCQFTLPQMCIQIPSFCL